MIKSNKRPENLAGLMGQTASQPAQMGMNETVDPLERLQQKLAGRTQGGSPEKTKLRRISLMNGNGLK